MDNVQPGQMLGPYRIINQVGEGGMATVYKAYHAGTDRYVAVKVLPPEFARSASFKGRFQQEARLIASLEHPHILPIHDVGESDGVHFFVMRFLDTGTLTNRMTAGPLSLAEIDRLFSQITDALGYAHQRGIVHRDIKPSNVMLDQRGDVFLTDFGIAKILEGGSSKFTTTGAITGTPAYMSPEQAQGDAVDQRSDIYSLGIVLYEMLTGRVPFEAETPLAVALKHISAPLPLPTALNPDIDPEIEKVVLKALAKDKNDRYATCAEFLAAWRQAYAIATAPGRADVMKKRTPPKIAAATHIGALTASQTGQPVGAPRKPGLPMGVLATVGAGILVLVCLAVVVTGGVLFNFANGGLGLLPGAKTSTPIAFTGPSNGQTPSGSGAEPNATATAPLVAGTQPPSSGAQPILLPGLTPTAADNAWRSWTGGNTIYNIIVQGDTLFTTGPGALTQWNATDGSVVRQLTTQDGLPGDPNDIVMGDDGSLWVSTVRGLARWQGSKLSLYGSDDGLGSSTIVPLLRLHDGRLLAGTWYSGTSGEGLSVFENGKWSFWPGFPSASPDTEGNLSPSVNTLLEAPDNSLWVGTDKGLGHWDGTNWQIYETKDGLPDNTVIHLSFSREGKLLVGTAVGAAIFEGQTFKAFAGEKAPNYRVYGIEQDTDGNYWLAGSGGVYRYNPVTDDWKVWNTTDSALLTYDAYGGKFLSNGNFIIGTQGNGLVQFNNDGPQTNWKVPNQPVAGGEYLGMGLAPDGLLWVGGNNGIDAIDPQTETWRDTQQDVPGTPLAFDPSGNLWAGHNPSGITILAPDGTRTELTERQGLTADQLTNDVAFEEDGSAWLATSTGLAFFDGQTVKVIATGQELGFPSAIVQHVFRASDNSIWATGERLVARRQPDGTITTFKAGTPFDTDDVAVWAVTQDKTGSIWIGTSSNGVYSYSPEGVWKQYLPGDPGVTLPDATVYSIAVTPADGSLWFGTYGGLAHLADGKWTSIKAGPNTYVNSVINNVFVTNDGTVWLATQGGVSRFKP